MAVKFARHLKRRFASSDDDVDGTGTVYRTLTPPGSTTVYSEEATKLLVDNRYYVGWDTPNYHERMNAGELMPMTPWRSFEAKGSTDGAMNLDITWSGGTNGVYYTTSNYSPNDHWIVTEEDLASAIPDYYHQYVQEAAGAIYASGFDALTFLAEIASVRRMFASLAKSLVQAKIPNNIRKVSGSWLATRYGWRTLIYDIQDINKAIINLKSGFDRYSEGRGGQYSTTVTDAWQSDHGNYVTQATLDDRITVGMRGHVVADINVPRVQLNPLVTGWEIIPFSFVIDWFFSIGKALTALSFLNAESTYVASAGYEVKLEREFNVSVIPGSESSIVNSVTRWQTAACTGTLKVRTPCRVSLIPRYALRLNQFKIIDLLGLINQRLPRR